MNVAFGVAMKLAASGDRGSSTASVVALLDLKDAVVELKGSVQFLQFFFLMLRQGHLNLLIQEDLGGSLEAILLFFD